jgi:hypothetical protein
VNPSDGPEEAIPGRLDLASHQMIRRFVILLALVMLWAFTLNSEHPMLALSAMTFIATGIEVFHACLRREGFNGASLNHWDTAIGFMGLSSLARGLS